MNRTVIMVLISHASTNIVIIIIIIIFLLALQKSCKLSEYL